MLRFKPNTSNRFYISLALLVLFASAESHAAAVILDRLEASVNSSIILTSDVNKFKQISRLRAQLDPLFSGTSLATKGSAATKSEIINFLIDDRLIALQYPISDSEAEQEINSIQTNNHLDRAGLKSALSEQNYKFEDYFELIRTSASKRMLIDRDIRPKVTVSEDDIKNHFYGHYAGKAPGNRAYHLQIISISVKNYKSLKAANDIANQSLKEIKAGESFEEVAKRISDDPSAASGGDLGTLPEDQISSAFDQVKKLQIGEVSSVLGGTAAGRFLILKLVDVKSNEGENLEKMKDQIRNQLTTSEFAHQISLWLERQRQTAFIHRSGESPLKELISLP
ncbi:MAG: peptidylprolyl isomerase [Bdellovibrionia bacterium]